MYGSFVRYFITYVWNRPRLTRAERPKLEHPSQLPVNTKSVHAINPIRNTSDADIKLLYNVESSDFILPAHANLNLNSDPVKVHNVIIEETVYVAKVSGSVNINMRVCLDVTSIIQAFNGKRRLMDGEGFITEFEPNHCLFIKIFRILLEGIQAFGYNWLLIAKVLDHLF